MTNRIILLRHGQSEANVDYTVYERKHDHLIELSALGKDQAEKSGEKIKQIIGDTSPLDVFVSPYTRTMQTWENVKKGLHRNNINMELDPRIREQEFQVFKDSKHRSIMMDKQKEQGKFWYRFKNAESGCDVYSRVSTFLTELRLDRQLFSSTHDCLLVAHEITLRCTLMKILKLDVNGFDQLPDIENCSPIVLLTDDFKTAKFDAQATIGNHALKQYLVSIGKG